VPLERAEPSLAASDSAMTELDLVNAHVTAPIGHALRVDPATVDSHAARQARGHMCRSCYSSSKIHRILR
jgi:hypothetical protein